MTGPGHFREAERLLTPRVRLVPVGYGETIPGDVEPPSGVDIALAAVHATLALAAATALPFLPDLCSFSDSKPSPAEVWREVIS